MYIYDIFEKIEKFFFEKITIFKISILIHMTITYPTLNEVTTLRDTLSKKKFALFRQSTYDEKIIS